MKLPVVILPLIALAVPAFAQAGKLEKPLVYVPVLPYEWLFERVGGDWIEVETIVGEGDDCHEYSPTPKQLAGISKANLIFSGDLGFEGNFFVKLGDGIDAPKEISLLEGLDLLEGSCEVCEHEHEHAEPAEGGKQSEEAHDHHHHDHAELKDPHVWLSPKMLMQQADRVASILKEFTVPAAAAAIDENVAALKAELTAVHEELTVALEPMKGQTFYVYHGAFAYFAQAYGLEQKAIEVTGRRPSPKQLAGIASQAKEDNVKVIFVQPQFDQSSAASLAETIGGTVQELDPLEKDVIGNLRAIAAAIRKTR
ncbi:MAG: zinc ABC transporter substrate-binding protein [Verrucomicrobiales bacterium]|nr:zinc ABC transporter substrate-binding protein [Verrucomicrobiales bacterium]